MDFSKIWYTLALLEASHTTQYNEINFLLYIGTEILNKKSELYTTLHTFDGLKEFCTDLTVSKKTVKATGTRKCSAENKSYKKPRRNSRRTTRAANTVGGVNEIDRFENEQETLEGGDGNLIQTKIEIEDFFVSPISDNENVELNDEGKKYTENQPG